MITDSQASWTSLCLTLLLTSCHVLRLLVLLKGWSGLLDRSYTSLSLESGAHVPSVTKSQDWIIVVSSALFPSCSPALLTSLMFPPHLSCICLVSPALLRLFPHQSAFPTYQPCISSSSSALFLVFFQPISSIPDHRVFPLSASLHLRLIPSLVQCLFMSSLIPLLCFFSPDIVFPWSCHVCLFLPLILNKLDTLIFLPATLCNRVHPLCSSMTVIEGKHEYICMYLSAGFIFKVWPHLLLAALQSHSHEKNWCHSGTESTVFDRWWNLDYPKTCLLDPRRRAKQTVEKKSVVQFWVDYELKTIWRLARGWRAN